MLKSDPPMMPQLVKSDPPMMPQLVKSDSPMMPQLVKSDSSDDATTGEVGSSDDATTGEVGFSDDATTGAIETGGNVSTTDEGPAKVDSASATEPLVLLLLQRNQVNLLSEQKLESLTILLRPPLFPMPE